MDPQVLILVPTLTQSPLSPEETPLGRAALKLADEGIQAVFGAGDTTWCAKPGAWERTHSNNIIAVHDRFPSQSRPTEYEAARSTIIDLPMGNPATITRLCRDKITCQQHLESHGIPMPEIESDPNKFADRLSTWRIAFLKPRYGGLGRGVHRVVPGDSMPAWGEGAVPGVEEPLFLQKAVSPPAGAVGVAMRWLLKRMPSGDWHPRTPVARVSHADPVVNVARGAQAVPAREILSPDTLNSALELCQRAARALQDSPNGQWALEFGIDMVIDQQHTPHIIEINSRPQGRLEHLALRGPAWRTEHIEACAQPIRTLATLAKHTR